MSDLQLKFENLTAMATTSIQQEQEQLFDATGVSSNFLFGFNNSLLLFDNDSSNYNLIIDNLSKAFNLSPENFSYFDNESAVVVKQRNYREALTIISVISVFYGIIFVSGIIGNLITCIVISRNKYMHTATNFYLFNLAISDLLLLLSGLPQEIYSLWHPRSYPFTDIVCILESTLLETAANVTVLTITAFSVERYIAICHPFRQHSMSKLSRAIKFILAIWVAAFILALPQAMQFAVIAEHNTTSCTLKNWFYGYVFAVSGCVFFVGPMTAICVLYVLIGIKLKKSKLLQSVKRYDRGISAQTRVIRMLIAVAVAFFLCWAPFHAQRLMAVYGSTVENPSRLFKKIFPVLNHISGVMYYLSTCINPLLYNIMSHKFRNAFKLTLARQCGLFSSYQTQNNNYYSALPRQNGSMRLNMSSLDHRTTVMQLNKMESDLSLLHDNNINNPRRLSTRSHSMGNHYRCVSVSSQSTLMTTLSKNDMYSTVTNVTPNRHNHSVNSHHKYGNHCHHHAHSCSPSEPPADDMQLSAIDDNLDEFADSHRLKNVQRYQQSAAKEAVNTKDKYNEQYHQLALYPTAVTTGHGKPVTVSVILPSKKFKSCSLSSSTSTVHRKSFEAHPNSMMALNNNGANKVSFVKGSSKEVVFSDHHHHPHHHHHQQSRCSAGCKKQNSRESDTATIGSKVSNKSKGILRRQSHTTDDNFCNSNSCSSTNSSCSCNSQCSDTNKCDKISTTPSSSTTSSSSSSFLKTTNIPQQLREEQNQFHEAADSCNRTKGLTASIDDDSDDKSNPSRTKNIPDMICTATPADKRNSNASEVSLTQNTVMTDPTTTPNIATIESETLEGSLQLNGASTTCRTTSETSIAATDPNKDNKSDFSNTTSENRTNCDTIDAKRTTSSSLESPDIPT